MIGNGPFFPWAGRIVVIAPECMGYRSLSAMAVLAVVLAIWQRPGLINSFLLLLAGAVLSVIGNVLRIAFLLGCMLVLSDEWYTPIHDVAGFCAIVIEAIILGSFCDWLKRRKRNKEGVNGKGQ